MTLKSSFTLKKGDYGWFDLDLYKSFPKNNLAQWSWALQTRQTALGFVKSGDKKLLQGNPNIIEKWFMLEVQESLREITFAEFNDSTPCVKHLNIWELTEIWLNLERYFPLSLAKQAYIDFMHQEAISCLSNLDEDTIYETINHSADDAFNLYCLDDIEAARHDGYTILSIDLNAPDKLLIEQFKNNIQQCKEARRIGLNKKKGVSSIKEITQKDMDRWYNQQVLAYIDIKFWSDYSEDGLTNEQIGNILFPNEYDKSLAEKVRNTVSVIAKEILNTSVIRALQYQARVAFSDYELMKGKTTERDNL